MVEPKTRISILIGIGAILIFGPSGVLAQDRSDVEDLEVIDDTAQDRSNVEDFKVIDDTVKVDCEELAIALITWDQLLATTDENERTDIEDTLGESGIANGLFEDWIDNYLNGLQDDVNDQCTNLKDDIKDYLENNEFEVP